ncbi:hypothetical protein FACS1894102_4560 [Spirochaetia bacterium]|nr:hypothetical protein FACS1894102_4560 [Spirochaetia bacterium]
MINPKLAGIVAGFAFALSFLLGVINKTSFGVSLLRALIFAIIFFGIAAGIELLYKKFLEPDISGGTGGLGDDLGSNVDISLGDDLGAANGDAAYFSIDDIDAPPANSGDANDAGELETLDGAEETGTVLGTQGQPENDGVAELEALDSAQELTELDEGLDQNSKKVYHNIGSTISGKSSGADSLNIGSFVPGLVAVDVAPRKAAVAAKTEYDMDSGTVEMSIAGNGDGEPDFKVDGKKAAGAIQTLLSKDEK